MHERGLTCHGYDTGRSILLLSRTSHSTLAGPAFSCAPPPPPHYLVTTARLTHKLIVAGVPGHARVVPPLGHELAHVLLGGVRLAPHLRGTEGRGLNDSRIELQVPSNGLPLCLRSLKAERKGSGEGTQHQYFQQCLQVTGQQDMAELSCRSHRHTHLPPLNARGALMSLLD